MARPGLLRFTLSAFLLCCSGLGQDSGSIYTSVPPVDASELAHRGPHAVGVRTLEIVNPGQVDILRLNKETGKAPLYDRPLTLEVRYPAIIPDGQREHTLYTSAMPGQPEHRPAGVPDSFQIAGKALRDAPPSISEGAIALLVGGVVRSQFREIPAGDELGRSAFRAVTRSRRCLPGRNRRPLERRHMARQAR